MNAMTPNVPVAQAILDTHVSVRQKIEAANLAVLEAVRVALESGEALAPNLFAASEETLQSLHSAKMSDLKRLAMTGVPLFTLRLTQSNVADTLSGHTYSADDVFHALLQTFSKNLPIGKI